MLPIRVEFNYELNLSLILLSSHIYSLDFTHDDNFLLSGSADETVMIWSMEEEAAAGAPSDSDVAAATAASLSYGPSFDVKFFPDGTSRMAAPDDTNSVQLLEEGHSLFRSPPDGASRITAVALSADASTVAYGCERGAVRLIRPGIGLLKLLGFHAGAVNDVAVGADGVTVVSAGEDKVVRIFRDGAKAFFTSVAAAPVVSVLLFGGGGEGGVVCGPSEPRVLSRSADGVAYVWSASTGEMLASTKNGDAGAGDDGDDDHVTFMDVSEAAKLVALARVHAKKNPAKCCGINNLTLTAFPGLRGGFPALSWRPPTVPAPRGARRRRDAPGGTRRRREEEFCYGGARPGQGVQVQPGRQDAGGGIRRRRRGGERQRERANNIKQIIFMMYRKML